jgi:hypothetical protein
MAEVSGCAGSQAAATLDGLGSRAGPNGERDTTASPKTRHTNAHAIQQSTYGDTPSANVMTGKRKRGHPTSNPKCVNNAPLTFPTARLAMSSERDRGH